MKLTIFLALDEVLDFVDVLQESKLTGDDRYELVSAFDDSFDGALYVQSSKAGRPAWIEFLKSGFDYDFGAISNNYNSAVMLLRVSERIFAVPFGQGYHALELAKFEPDFGLKTALNMLPEEIRTLDTRTLDASGRQQRTRISRPGLLSEFEVNEYVDWIGSIEGKPRPGLSLMLNRISNVGGSNSLKIGCDWKLEEVFEGCSELITSFLSDHYKEHFAFVDNFRPLPKDSPLKEPLNEELSALLNRNDTEWVGLALPELGIDYSRLDHFKFSRGTTSEIADELDLDVFYKVWNSLDEADKNLNAVSVLALGDDDKPVSTKRPIADYLVAEVKYQSKRYIYALKRWFLVSDSYLDAVERELAGVEDVTERLQMPNIREGETEGSYNERVAGEKRWLGMDKSLFKFGTQHEKIEACDLLTPENEFICVKKMSASASLSHLFAQGSVSALLMKDERYQKKLKQIVKKATDSRFDHIPKTESGRTIVYAMATTKQGELKDSMFFFSRVNLLTHVRQIRGIGLDVAICKIDFEEAG